MEELKELEEDKVYHLHLSEGLKIAVIKGNTDSFKWVSHWLPILREKGMVSLATFVHASTVKQPDSAQLSLSKIHYYRKQII